MTITGIVQQVGEILTGTSKAGKDWQKQQIIIADNSNTTYPKSIAVNLLGSNVATCRVGDSVVLDVNIESREYNSRWYTDVTAYKVMIASRPVPESVINPEMRHDAEGEGQDLPF